MPKGEDITTRFKVDISDLKKGISEANKNIKLANAEFKAVSAGMDDWAKSSDGVQAKLKQLETILTAQNQKLENYKKQQKEIDKAYQENGKRADDLKAKLQDLASQGVSKTSEEYKKYQKALTEVEKEQEANKKASENMTITILNQQAVVNKTKVEIEKYNNSLNELQKESAKAVNSVDKLIKEINEQENELSSLKKAYANIILEQGKTSNEAKQLASKISSLNKELNENKSKLKETKNATESLTDSLDDVDDSNKEASGGFTVMKGTLASLVAEGIKKAIEAFKDLAKESITASNKLQASIGATDEEMSQFNKEMQNVYNNNYGESLQDVGDKMAYIKQVTGEVDPSKIGKLTENAIALEDTFGSDFNETIRGVSNLMNHFGIDSETAFDLFAKGSQLGLDYTSELGDNIAEYGGNFQQAGYSAEEYFQLLVNGSKGGAYNLDKVNDSINEVKNRLGDGTIEKNLGVFSKGTQQAFKEWKNGHGTMKDVIDSIVGDISNCSNEQKKLTMAATAFGTMGEDANLKVVQSLTTVGDNFKDVKGTMESVKDVRYDDIGSSLSELGRTLKSELLQPIIDTIAPVIKDLVKWVLDNLPTVVPIVTGLATAFGILATALAIQGIINGVAKAMTFLNTTLLANPFVLIVAAIAGLVVAFISLWNKSEEFRNFWIGLWEGIKNVVQTVWEAIVGFFSSAWEKIKSIWNGVGEFFSAVWEAIKVILEPIAQWFYETVIAPIKEKIEIIVFIFTSAWTLISQLAQGCWNLIVAVWTVVSEWFNTNVIQPVVGFFTSLWNTISTAASTAWEFIKSVWNAVYGWFDSTIIQPIKNVFSGMWETLKNGASSAWEGIKSIFANVTNWFRNKFSEAWTAVKNVFSVGGKIFDGIKEGIVNAFKTTVNAIIRGINKVVKIPFEGLNNTLDKLQNIDVAGVQPFGGLTWRTKIPQIPELEHGIGLAKKGHQYLLEGKGNEAVVPLDKSKPWIKSIANELKSQLFNLEGSLANAPNSITNSNVNNFTQVINASKQPSRIELYRQTKNLLKLKGV